MSITKNPFERPFRGSSKPPEPKPDVTMTPHKRASMPDPEAASAPKKPVTHGGGLPPTRKSGEKGDEKTGPSAAGFQKANPFNTPKHPKVSNSGPQPEEPVTWDPKKNVPAASVPVVAATAQGMEIISPNAASNDYGKTYSQRLDAAEMTVAEKAAQKVTAENYQEVYEAEQQLKAEQQQKEMKDFIEDRQKQLEQAAANAHKARGLLAEMAQLQLQLVPDLSPDERYRIYGKLEELRVALAQIPFYG